jgi:ATP-dependent DNA ligase
MQGELDRIRIPESPFPGLVKLPGSVRIWGGAKPAEIVWVKPIVVCRVEYTEQTADGSLRHPVFQEIRPEVTPETVTMPLH